jgi:hypothetical protein
MRYFVKFHDGCQAKNKAQSTALEIMRTYGSVLLSSDTALANIVSDMKSVIEKVNIANRRCGDISFSSYIKHDGRSNTVNISDICSFSFYPVLSDLIVPEDETENEKFNPQTENVFNF